MRQASLQIINNATLQLWEKSIGTNMLRPCTSSVLISDGSSYYLITCSHTFSTNDNEEVDFGFMLGNTFYYLDGQRVSAPDTIEQGNCDMSVVKLEEDTSSILQKNGYSFITQEHLAINHIIEDHQQLYVCGYPANRTKRVYGDDGRPFQLFQSSEEGIETRCYPIVYKSIVVYLMLPVTLNDNYYNQLKIEKHLQYILDFHKDKLSDTKGRRISLPNPRGMSGCGLWGINQSNGDYYLVGIMTDFGENRPLMVATRIDYATELMRIVLNASFPQSEIVQVKWYRDDSIPYEIKKYNYRSGYNMALAINIEDLLNKQKIESNRIEFKKGWNPASIYHSVCAFANDFDDLGGGYILVGVDSDDAGMAIRPVEGVPIEKIDGILLDMVGYNNKLSPYYMPRTSVEEVDGKLVLVIWCPAGINRPYSVPENVTAKSGSKEYFYIRSGTSSIIAKGEVLDELRELASRVPFDERGNDDIQLEDISLVLLRDYLVKVGSRLADQVATTPLPKILDQMELYTGPKENRLIRNVAAMMFCENPSKFFPYTQIDVVTFPNGKLKDPNNFTEVTFKGSVPQMIKETMGYIKSNVLKEHVRKVSGRQEADRFWNYPYDAIEEAVVNSVYHRDFMQHEPIEITIEPTGISILNCPGPDRSIPKEDIERGDMLKSRRYRNRRLGDFLKELDLTEGRSTGVPTIQAKLAENGSPRAIFETTDDRLTFLVTIPIHEGCNQSSEISLKSSEKGSETTPKSSGTGSGTASESSGTRQKTSNKIIELIKTDPQITAPKIAMELGISTRGVEKNLRQLREAGIIKRVGSPTFGGYWEIATKEDK